LTLNVVTLNLKEKMHIELSKDKDITASVGNANKFVLGPEFDILKPKKMQKNNQMFTPEDVTNLQLIYHLGRKRFYTRRCQNPSERGKKKRKPR
jgi:hypothetical protein